MSKRSELRIMRVEGMESSVGVWLPSVVGVVERSIAVARARVRSIIVVVVIFLGYYYRFFEGMILLSI